MRLTDASVVIRPRRPWEAIDLGVLIARRHSLLLMGSWALVSLPVFALLTLLLWQYPFWAMLLFWWLKPAFERLPLYILSRALFGDVPSLRASLKAFPGLLKPQLLASLTWRRFSPVRSFALPVLLLERLSGQARRERLAVLMRSRSNAASGLTLIGMAIELALYLGIIALLYLMLPQAWVEQADWQQLIGASDRQALWIEHLGNLLYALVLVFWEPIYVACGFTLYLNRRTTLEAWDLELAFRRLRQRVLGALPVLLLCAGLLALPGVPVWAESRDEVTTAVDPMGPEAPRLAKQALTSSEARQAIQSLLDAPPFANEKTVKRWRFGPEQSEEDEDSKEPGALVKLLQKLLNGSNSVADAMHGLTVFLKVLIWAAVICLLVLLVWRYREWLRVFGSRLSLPSRRKRRPPSQLFGLEVTPESLPADVASEAERLWEQDPRAALGLLYRALLSRLLHDHQVPIKAAHTEGEVLALARALDIDGLSRLAEVLTRHWQNLAYGQVLPSQALKRGLCDSWRRQFGQGLQP